MVRRPAETSAVSGAALNGNGGGGSSTTWAFNSKGRRRERQRSATSSRFILNEAVSFGRTMQTINFIRYLLVSPVTLWVKGERSRTKPKGTVQQRYVSVARNGYYRF
jgi:hypothetical protein